MRAKYYVYRLIDPRNMSIFYIGKGSGNRLLSHEAEAARGVCSKKCNKINSIKKSGYNVIKEKIAHFWNEQDAYDFETDCILEIGLDNLTNIVPGGMKAFNRRVKARATLGKTTPPIMETIEKMSGHMAYWLRGLPIPEPTNNFTKMIVKWCDKYFPMALKMGYEENPKKMREIFSAYNINLVEA